MKRVILSLLVIILICACSVGSYAAGFMNDTESIEKATKSVLQIFVYESSQDLLDNNPFGTGSGFVAFNSTTLITNYHVIDGAEVVLASDDDDRMYGIGKVLCADKKADIAILGFSKPSNLEPLSLYPDNQLKRGAPVLAIGSPKGLKNTVSTGIISSLFDNEGIPEIQITAPISPGSSGGALFNDEGKVIGVTSATYRSKDEYGENTDAQNINFAVNIAVAQAMYNAWDGKEYSFSNHLSQAKMDFTGVYESSDKKSSSTQSTEVSEENWICSDCGATNNTKFCLNCGAEKPFWICVCGMENSSRFCGDCGRKCEEIIESFNSALTYLEDHNYAEAITALSDLGSFNSGSFETSMGKHSSTQEAIKKAYYEQGMYLRAQGEDHDSIITSFEAAGDYEDAKVLISEKRYV